GRAFGTPDIREIGCERFLDLWP
ncbi:MAG: hypothetical protein UY16_C0039G0010, partial [Candidatus Gottesmanbacteria bacterium GW2011_GWA2_47_9]